LLILPNAGLSLRETEGVFLSVATYITNCPFGLFTAEKKTCRPAEGSRSARFSEEVFNAPQKPSSSKWFPSWAGSLQRTFQRP